MIEAGVALPTLTSNNPLGELVLLIPTTLASAELRVHGSKEWTLPPGDTERTPLNYKF